MTADRLFETTSIPGHLAPTPERLERLLSKQTLEELYEVEDQPFARGKYATVRRCRERSNGRQWAAKFLRKRRRAQELRAEALHEVAVLDAAAHCPRLVSLHEVFETNTEMVLVLELAPGGELQMVLDRDEVPEERQVARLLRQILDGIAFLHSLNVAHLDIKPQNLVLTGEFPECDVKLCDFGISRYISHGADIREILGTPDYVAPEVLNYEPISLATDMWSVGVLLYVLLTGCSPFGGDTKQETFCNISRCRLDFPDDLFEDVSEDARDLMRKLMVKDPSERLTVHECLQHSWFVSFDDPIAPLSSTSTADLRVNDDHDSRASTAKSLGSVEKSSLPAATAAAAAAAARSSTPDLTETKIALLETDKRKTPSSSSSLSSITLTKLTTTTTTTTTTMSSIVVKTENTSDATPKSLGSRAVSSHTENIYSKPNAPSMPVRIGLSPDRRDTFKRNMDTLAQKFSTGTEIFVIEQAACASNKPSSVAGVGSTRRATATHTMPAGEVFKCTPVFILGEEQHCNDSGSDTVSEISTDSSSDRSSIYSDDSLDFILYGKSQVRASFPFTGNDNDRWEQHHRNHTRAWPRECNGVVSKALSRFTTETYDPKTNKPGASSATSAALLSTSSSTSSISLSSSSSSSSSSSFIRGKTGLEALRERGGNLVVIREPIRAGRYTRYSEVQCESVQARIRRFQIHGGS